MAEETKASSVVLPPTAASFSVWPPSERTRSSVTQRLAETLSTPSVLSQRYGVMDAEEAKATAAAIEEEAFKLASAFFSASSNEDVAENDGTATLQAYSKEISKRMLDAVKKHAAAATATPNSLTEQPSELNPDPVGRICFEALKLAVSGGTYKKMNEENKIICRY
ncbi:MFP1 attachment factor 1 isoform X1 [Amborella trichopoda]|uniref:MFP1 attachment factor 1 isoform X1 n=1 Tax=Amborella trichopoda TaxID=13333 RepID=UPI0009C0240A|nr:MFP1 attachment factor 1 isoform X1 [Amborella trichopoda]|eukprot:XP_020525926.1 MFP1 attachment factor 1 isoform X1 [Amborella trichopoda]